MFDLVLATDAVGGIGWQGQLPWPHNKEDMKRFAKLTKGGVVIMGRKTYESLPANRRPLPDRFNIVISSSLSLSCENVCPDFASALKVAYAQKDKPIFVIGGARVFKEAIDHPDLNKVYWTLFKETFTCDVYFSTIFCRFWRILSKETGEDADVMILQALTSRHIPSANASPTSAPALSLLSLSPSPDLDSHE